MHVCLVICRSFALLESIHSYSYSYSYSYSLQIWPASTLRVQAPMPEHTGTWPLSYYTNAGVFCACIKHVCLATQFHIFALCHYFQQGFLAQTQNQTEIQVCQTQTQTDLLINYNSDTDALLGIN